jgi:DNA-binding transcriptional regulator YdaS (Cro superfamily)
MTKRTQRFVFVGVAILVIGLGTGLVASYMGLPNLGIGTDGPAELAYVAPDATVIAFADVRQVMDSQLRQKLLKISPEADHGADAFQAETGINLQTDVDRIVASVSGVADPSNPANMRPLLLARGRFDTARIEAAIRAKGGTVEDYKKQRLITMGNELGLAFVEPDLAVVGVPSAVRRAIDTKASGQNVTGNADVMRQVRDFDNGNAWVVAHIEAVTSGNVIPAEIKQQLPPVTWLALNARIADGVNAVVRAEARDEAAANNLRDVVRGLVALARLQAGQHAQLAGLVNSLELGGEGTTVSLGLTVPPSVIDMLGVLRSQPPTLPLPQGIPGATGPRRPQPPTL